MLALLAHALARQALHSLHNFKYRMTVGITLNGILGNLKQILWPIYCIIEIFYPHLLTGL